VILSLWGFLSPFFLILHDKESVAALLLTNYLSFRSDNALANYFPLESKTSLWRQLCPYKMATFSLNEFQNCYFSFPPDKNIRDWFLSIHSEYRTEFGESSKNKTIGFMILLVDHTQPVAIHQNYHSKSWPVPGFSYFCFS
jgi:hypothetical protein